MAEKLSLRTKVLLGPVLAVHRVEEGLIKACSFFFFLFGGGGGGGPIQRKACSWAAYDGTGD